MGVYIPMSLESLGRSRFSITPSVEIIAGLRAYGSARPSRHLARWRTRAERSMSGPQLALLRGLVPVSHAYVPDFLSPPPARSRASIEETVAQVAATPVDEVAYHLDIAYKGRRIRPDVADSFGGDGPFDAWRRELPPAVEAALASGPATFAARVADAMAAYFTGAIEPDWADVLDVLQADVAYRGARMARLGAIALLDDLSPDVRWDSHGLRLSRPFNVLVDWADDGLLLIPSTADGRRVSFCAERPVTPSVIYPVRGVWRLWTSDRHDPRPAVADLIGETRAGLLASLDHPRSTGELSRARSLAPATVSYHLGILHRSGLVHRRRLGRTVVYERAPIADDLLSGEVGSWTAGEAAQAN